MIRFPDRLPRGEEKTGGDAGEEGGERDAGMRVDGRGVVGCCCGVVGWGGWHCFSFGGGGSAGFGVKCMKGRVGGGC